MSTARGSNTKGRPAHMNTFAFRHNTGSKKTARIARLPVHTMCITCTRLILWKKKYRKYKPRSQPGRCTRCHEKTLFAAYHVLCRGCARDTGQCAKCTVELTDENRPDMDEDGGVILDDEAYREQQEAAARPGDRRGLERPQQDPKSKGTRGSKAAGDKASKKPKKKKGGKKAAAAAAAAAAAQLPPKRWRKGDAAVLLNAGTGTPMANGVVVAAYGTRASVALDWTLADGQPAMAYVGVEFLRRPGQAGEQHAVDVAPALPAAAVDEEAAEAGAGGGSSGGSGDSGGRPQKQPVQGPKKNSFSDVIPKSRRHEVQFQQKHMQRARLPSNPKRGT